MIQCAIFCPGPSLAYAMPGDNYSLRIAVNRAAIRFACDYWSTIDWQLFAETVLPFKQSPTVFTTKNSADMLVKRGGEPAARFAGYSQLLHEDIQTDAPRGWRLFSVTSALVLAATHDAALVDVYGADMAGDGEFDGHQCDRNWRTDARWERERVIYQVTVDWMQNDKGIKVQRISHGIA